MSFLPYREKNLSFPFPKTFSHFFIFLRRKRSEGTTLASEQNKILLQIYTKYLFDFTLKTVQDTGKSFYILSSIFVFPIFFFFSAFACFSLLLFVQFTSIFIFSFLFLSIICICILFFYFSIFYAVLFFFFFFFFLSFVFSFTLFCS